jgi:hypothetical protein
MKKTIVAVIVALALAFTPIMATATTPPPSPHSTGGTSPVAVWLVMGCAASLIWAAWIANIAQNRQLTLAEANFCGLAYWLQAQAR